MTYTAKGYAAFLDIWQTDERQLGRNDGIFG